MKTIVITGASRGIGLALTQAYLDQGHRVVATYRSELGLEHLKALRYSETQLSCFPLEVTDSDAIKGLSAFLADETVDILINNAGVFGGLAQNYGNIDLKQWQHTFAVNAIAPIEISMALAPSLARAQEPKVIAISSMMASLERNSPNYYAYRSSKAALNKAIQCLAHDFKSQNIVVCPVHPGWVRTDMGGNEADISVEECIAGLVPLIDHLTLKDSGKFWQYNGEPMAW